MTESNKTEAARVPTNRDRAFARQFALLGLYEWRSVRLKRSL